MNAASGRSSRSDERQNTTTSPGDSGIVEEALDGSRPSTGCISARGSSHRSAEHSSSGGWSPEKARTRFAGRTPGYHRSTEEGEKRDGNYSTNSIPAKTERESGESADEGWPPYQPYLGLASSEIVRTPWSPDWEETRAASGREVPGTEDQDLSLLIKERDAEVARLREESLADKETIRGLQERNDSLTLANTHLKRRNTQLERKLEDKVLAMRLYKYKASSACLGYKRAAEAMREKLTRYGEDMQSGQQMQSESSPSSFSTSPSDLASGGGGGGSAQDALMDILSCGDSSPDSDL